jgi:hypothetical protein
LDMAARHSRVKLVLGLLGSVLFVAAGVCMLVLRANVFVGWSSVGFFGLCAVAWGYTLALKCRLPPDDKRPRGFEVLPVVCNGD